jgi:hypothetical protein
MMSSTSVVYRWSSCEITWQNFIFSLLTAAKVNCASAWVNPMARRSGQNGGSRTATLDTSDGELSAASVVELSVASMLCRGHQCGMSPRDSYHCIVTA